MTSAAQKRAAQIVKALLAKTEDNGCTEEEALAALEKARELMDRHGLTEDAIREDAATIGKGDAKNATADRDSIWIRIRLMYWIGRYADCINWYQDEIVMPPKEAARQNDLFGGSTGFSGGAKGEMGKAFIFFGTESDREFAGWLLTSLDAFVRRGALTYIATDRTMWVPPTDRPYKPAELRRLKADHVRRLRDGFIEGCVLRINERLRKLVEERDAKSKGGSGRDLVVVKTGLVRSAFEATGMKLRSGSANPNRGGENKAREAGSAAGDRAALGRPVNGPGATILSLSDRRRK